MTIHNLKDKANASKTLEQRRKDEERLKGLTFEQQQEEKRKLYIEGWAITKKVRRQPDEINSALDSLRRYYYKGLTNKDLESVNFLFEDYLAEIWHRYFERHHAQGIRPDGSNFETLYRKIPLLTSQPQDNVVNTDKQLINLTASLTAEQKTPEIAPSTQDIGKPDPSDQPGIYYITCTKTGSIYVGESVHVRQRWGQHINQLQRREHHNYKLQKEVAIHGLDSFTFELIEPIKPITKISFFDLKILLWAREIWHIKNLKELGVTVHNLTDGGGDIADFNDMNISVTASEVSDLLAEAKTKSLHERQHEPLNPVDANPISLKLVINENELPPSVPQHSDGEAIPNKDRSSQVVAPAPISSKNTGNRPVKSEESKVERSPVLIFFVAIFVLFFASLPLLKFFNNLSDSIASPSTAILPTPSLPRANSMTPAPSPPLERVNPENSHLSTESAREKAMKLTNRAILKTESSKNFGQSSSAMLLVCVHGKDEIAKFASRIDDEDHELLGPLMSNVDLHNFKCADLIFSTADVYAVRNGTYGKDSSVPQGSAENSFKSPSVKPIKTIRESSNCNWGYVFESGGCQPIVPKQNEQIHITGKSTECKLGAVRNEQGECKFPNRAPTIR